MKTIPELCLPLRGKLLVSCQASAGDAFRDANCMARFARAAVAGGAAGIRAEGADDIRAIRAAVNVPIIGIRKSHAEDGGILITPSFEEARALVAAGADMVALDCTARGQAYGALDRLRRIRRELNVPVLADIATVEEARAAAEAGADVVLSTMRGYTADTRHLPEFDSQFIADTVRSVNVPVVAEGRIWTLEQARAAMAAGAFAVIVGTAITRPQDITRRFAAAVETEAQRREATAYFVGVDLGGTNIKSGLVSDRGELISNCVQPTPAQAGREALMQALKTAVRDRLADAREKGIAPVAIGVATAGWPNPATGEVVYATDNIPGWMGAQLGEALRNEFALPLAVQNDANALAVGERHFGAARGVEDFICVTLGTGVGCGIYLGGKLHTGAHSLANSLGHIQIESDGPPCTCGKRGCLEAYANAASLVRYAGDAVYGSAEQVIAAANAGENAARRAIQTYARHLAHGCVVAIQLLDPALLIFAGGITQGNPALLAALREELSPRLLPTQRGLMVRFSPLGYFGGVVGAAASALEQHLH